MKILEWLKLPETRSIENLDDLGVYVEYLGVAGEVPNEAYFSGGLTLATGENFQWDLGVLLGLNSAAEDISVFQGFTWRF